LLDVASLTPNNWLRGHMMAVHAVAFSRDGRRVITGGGPGEAVKIWDMATRQELIGK